MFLMQEWESTYVKYTEFQRMTFSGMLPHGGRPFLEAYQSYSGKPGTPLNLHG